MKNYKNYCKKEKIEGYNFKYKLVAPHVIIFSLVFNGEVIEKKKEVSHKNRPFSTDALNYLIGQYRKFIINKYILKISTEEISFKRKDMRKYVDNIKIERKIKSGKLKFYKVSEVSDISCGHCMESKVACTELENANAIGDASSAAKISSNI